MTNDKSGPAWGTINPHRHQSMRVFLSQNSNEATFAQYDAARGRKDEKKALGEFREPFFIK